MKLTSPTLRFYATNGETAQAASQYLNAYEKFGEIFTYYRSRSPRREGRVLRVSAWPDTGSAIGIRKAGPWSDRVYPRGEGGFGPLFLWEGHRED